MVSIFSIVVTDCSSSHFYGSWLNSCVYLGFLSTKSVKQLQRLSVLLYVRGRCRTPTARCVSQQLVPPTRKTSSQQRWSSGVKMSHFSSRRFESPVSLFSTCWRWFKEQNQQLKCEESGVMWKWEKHRHRSLCTQKDTLCLQLQTFCLTSSSCLLLNCLWAALS